MNPNRKKDAMKKVIVAGLALFLASSCTRVVEVQSIATDPVETVVTDPPKTATTSRPALATNGTDGELLDLVYEMHPTARYMGMEADIISAAMGTCESLDNGVSIYEIAAAVGSSASNDDTLNLLSSVAVAAVLVKCPEYTYLLESLGSN